MEALWDTHAFWLLPVLIFLARVIDVSIGTLRIVFLSRGMKILAPLCGFFEVLVWLIAMGQIMQNLGQWSNFIAFAAGFAMGNYVGLVLEEWLAMGTLSLWVIARQDAGELLSRLQRESVGITRIGARGATGKVRLIVSVIRRKDLERILRIVRDCEPQAFVTVQDVRSVQGGVFPSNLTYRHPVYRGFGVLRKGK